MLGNWSRDRDLSTQLLGLPWLHPRRRRRRCVWYVLLHKSPRTWKYTLQFTMWAADTGNAIHLRANFCYIIHIIFRKYKTLPDSQYKFHRWQIGNFTYNIPNLVYHTPVKVNGKTNFVNWRWDETWETWQIEKSRQLNFWCRMWYVEKFPCHFDTTVMWFMFNVKSRGNPCNFRQIFLITILLIVVAFNVRPIAYLPQSFSMTLLTLSRPSR